MYNDFDKTKIMDDISNIQMELENERNKPKTERDINKENKLIYQQFIKGLKLSTGNKLF